MPEEIVCQIQEPEAQTLLQFYAPWGNQAALFEIDPNMDQNNRDIQELMEIWRGANKGGAGDSRLHEEQEREIAVEVEREQQVCRPPPVKPLNHSAHPDIRYFVKNGDFRSRGGFLSVCRAFDSLRQTSASQFNFPSTLGPRLYASQHFVRTIHQTRNCLNDEFLKSVRWILSNTHNPGLLVLSQYEVNELLPDIQASMNTALHVYTPRTTKGMRPFHLLDFFTIGSANTNVPPQSEISQDLELFAGSLYFDSFSAYERFRLFLGLRTDAFANATEELASPEGFVDEETRQAVGWPIHSPFQSNPLPFLGTLYDMRGKGHGYLQTHVGTIVRGVPLTEDRL